MEEVIGDRYELREPIGRGGMATIFRAVDYRMGRSVAVKILRDVYSSDPKFVTRFQREARAASALQHPNIVQVFDYGQSGESYYIVMEFVDGADLRRYLKRTGTLTAERTVEIAHDVALGLGAAHRRGIVHRDVKPQNVLLNDEGLVKLTDFGIASMYRDAGAERLTTTGMTLGTVQYYAPEQAQGEVVSPAADVYALGIVMYELLTGQTPFDGETPVAVAMHHIQDMPEPPSRLNPRIPPPLERIIMRCLEKDPRDRYKDGDALAYALENMGRAPVRRPSGVATAEGRLTTPGPRTGPGPRSGPARAAYNRQGAGSGPRMRGPGNAPPVLADDYEGPLGGGGFGITRPQGPAPGTTPHPSSGPYGMARRPDQQRRRGGAGLAIIITSIVVLLLASCVLVTVLSGGVPGFARGGGSPTATVAPLKVRVPALTGLQQDAATAQATAAHLKVVTKAVTDDRTKGLVLEQIPTPGTLANVGDTVTLTVSNGPGPIEVPDVVKKPSGDACLILSQAGLTCVTAGFEQSSTVAFGAVTKTVPAAGAKVQPDGDKTVKIYISSGAPTPTTAPATPTAGGSTPTATKTPCPTPLGGGTPPPTC